MTDKNISENCKQNIRNNYTYKTPTSQKRNTLSKSKPFAFGLKPIELRCKSGRVLIRKWAVYDTQTAHLFMSFSMLSTAMHY